MDIPVVPKVGKRKVKEVLLTLSVIIVLLAIVLFPWADAYRQLGTYDWEEVQATVDISEIREYGTIDGDGWNENPYISYSYTIDGESFNDDDIVLFDLNEGDFGFSTSLVDEYPYGSEITAYYNSEDPNQAVLIKGFSGVLPVIIMFLGMIIWFHVAVVIFLIVWKILFHIQPAGNRKKAEQKYADDEDDERHEREMYWYE